MLSAEFHAFHGKWLAKADQYEGQNLLSAFDRFFTLFVIYNRLYAETTFHIARQGQLNLANKTSFPDSAAATDYVVQFLGSNDLIKLFEASPESARGIQEMIALLAGPIGGRQFNIKLDMIHGNAQRDEDIKLLGKFRSNGAHDRATAVLEFIYAVRCNLFHGHKSFDAIQLEVMRPANTLLRHVIEILFGRLDAADSY